MKVKVEVSARHLHITEDDFKKLFGNIELTKRNDLYEKGQFASNQTVEIVGPEFRINKARILGPFRDYTQLEISKTDAVKLGIDAPIMLSGEGPGAHVKIVGPKGAMIKNIAIIAKRHLHLSSKSAKIKGFRNGEKVSAYINSDRPTTFKDITVRIDDSFTDSLHLDTDEANAADVGVGSVAEIIKEKK